jgi:hypothetical protein
MVGASEEGVVVQGGGFTGATLSDQSQTRPAPPTPPFKASFVGLGVG